MVHPECNGYCTLASTIWTLHACIQPLNLLKFWNAVKSVKNVT